MVERTEYLERLMTWKDEKVIKVVTGICRCGKSTLLSQFQKALLTQGVSKEQIISINLEDLRYEELLDYRKLNNYITERLCEGKTRCSVFCCENQRFVKAAGIQNRLPS